MRLKVLEQWICDTCGGLIQEPRHGYVEWRAGVFPDGQAYGFRIVHTAPASPHQPYGHCYAYEHAVDRADLELPTLLVAAGIARLSTFLAPSGWGGAPQPPTIKDLNHLWRSCGGYTSPTTRTPADTGGKPGPTAFSKEWVRSRSTIRILFGNSSNSIEDGVDRLRPQPLLAEEQGIGEEEDYY